MARIDNSGNRFINSFYLHYKDATTGEDVYELVKIDEHESVELDLEWKGFSEIPKNSEGQE